MKFTRFLISAITLIVIISSCLKDELTTPENDAVKSRPGEIAVASTIKSKLNIPVLTTTVTGSTMVVSWESIPNAVEYHVVFEGIGAPSSQKVTATSLTVSGLSAGSYGVKVSALAENSNTSIFIDSGFSGSSAFTVGSVSPVVKTKLPAPQVTAGDVSYNSGQGSATISWSGVTHATGYSVTVNGAAVSSNSSPLSLSNLEPGTYSIGVTALTADANFLSSDPGTVTVTVKARRPLSTPTVSGSVTYTAPTAGSVSVTPLFIWPPNNKLVTVNFVGTGLISTGTGTISASNTTVPHATSYVMSPSSLSNLAPGNHTVSVTAIAGGTYTDDNWVNSSAGNKSFDVLAGSLTYRLIDEYGVYTKNYTLSSNFNLPIQLMASRLGTDMNGRDYTFVVTATNGAGISTNSSTVSNVPHDQRK